MEVKEMLRIALIIYVCMSVLAFIATQLFQIYIDRKLKKKYPTEYIKAKEKVDRFDDVRFVIHDLILAFIPIINLFVILSLMFNFKSIRDRTIRLSEHTMRFLLK